MSDDEAKIASAVEWNEISWDENIAQTHISWHIWRLNRPINFGVKFDAGCVRTENRKSNRVKKWFSRYSPKSSETFFPTKSSI